MTTQFYRYRGYFGRIVTPLEQNLPIHRLPVFHGQNLVGNIWNNTYVWGEARMYYIGAKRDFHVYKVVPVRYRVPIYEACLNE